MGTLDNTVVPADDELISRSVSLASALAERAQALGGPSMRRQQRRLRRLLASDSGARLVFSLADRVLRPVDALTSAGQLRTITAGPLDGLSAIDRAMLRLAGAASRVVAFPVIMLVRARLRYETRALVYPAQPRLLGRRLAALKGRPNLNLLGEAVLGEDEAARRLAAVESLLARQDVDCVSVKVSAVASGLSLVDFEGSVQRICEPLQKLYRAAASAPSPKLVNLDMEEHRDLDLTVESFTRCLSMPEFSGLRAGIALQAYLPETHVALERLLRFAEARAQSGGAPFRVRLVKGANLAMEKTAAELACWPPPTYEAKAQTDASYKALLARLLEAAGAGLVEVGVASHNLFDVAFALVLSQALGATAEIEMLAGMADDQAAAVAERTSRVLLYTPVVARRDFRNALAYLARRLDENATPEGYLHHALELVPGSAAWQTEANRFADAVRARHLVGTERPQRQDRLVEAVGEGLQFRPGPDAEVEAVMAGRGAGPGREGSSGRAFANEPATDLTVPANRQWALAALAGPALPGPTPVTDGALVHTAVDRARSAAGRWGAMDGAKRTELLTGAADLMARRRGDALAVMASEAGKTVEEADPEISEAIDYARWYGSGTGSLERLLADVDGALESEPLGVVVVAPPWNFPYAIPAGGALAALAAGNTVVLKPAPEARATAAVLVGQLHDAGIDDSVLQLLPLEDGPAGRTLVTHPDVDGVVLTGSYETAQMFLTWAPRRRLLAETSGKNSIIISATADVDQAVRDVVASAFGHAGQKCSAASLAIVVAPVYDRSPFLRQLADAVKSLRPGPATSPATQVGPVVGPFTKSLEQALTRLSPWESWLVAPVCLDTGRIDRGPVDGGPGGGGPVSRGRGGRLWSPGVRTGVRPGSWAHTTEWFGPVLGVMRAATFEEALAWQNAVPYGLTAGLSSLDPEEHRRWAAAVEAGNLYVNRSTTGAVVGRQPFGGWKRSSVGPTAKAGGPNYLIGLRRWRDASLVTPEEAVASYRSWWERHFGRATELAGMPSESNELRYRPFLPGVIVRAAEGVADDDLRKAVALSGLTGTRVSFSFPQARPGFERGSGRGAEVVVESGGSFAASLRRHQGSGGRLRLLGEVEDEVVEAAAAAGLSVLDEPICSCGRVELPRWLREQVLTRSLHRYGNVVYSR